MLKDKANRDLDGLEIGTLNACEVGETGAFSRAAYATTWATSHGRWPGQPCPSCCSAGTRRVSQDDTVRGRSWHDQAAATVARHPDASTAGRHLLAPDPDLLRRAGSRPTSVDDSLQPPR